MSSHSFDSTPYSGPPASSTSQMAETQTAPILPPPFPDFSQRRISHAFQLPPLTIPPPRRELQQSGSYPNLPQLPAIHSAPAQSLQTIPPPPSSAPRIPQSRQPSDSAAPLANLLSPRPSTPPTSDSGFSPHYEKKRSPPRSFVEPPPPAARPAIERYGVDESRFPGRVGEPSYASPIDPQYRQQALIPSPSYTPTYPPRSHMPPSHRGSAGSIFAPSPSTEGPQAPLQPMQASLQPPAPIQAPPSIQAPAQIPPPTMQAAPPPGPGLERSPLQYELRVRQQPIAARACGFGERDRRVIDPPPIIQLLVRDPRTGTQDLDELRYSLNIVHCTLWSADGLTEETALEQPDRRRTRRLMGQLVASPSVAKDEHDIEGCFFCFPDLSCRTHGRYRLRFVLMRIDPANLHVGGFSPILTEVLSDVFTVYTAKDFPGMRPSSALTRALKLQGCNIQVKKGNEKALARKRQSISEADDQGREARGEGREDDRPRQRRRKDSAS